MTDQTYPDPYADVIGPYDDAYADDVPYPLATAQPAPRTPRAPLRVRMAEGMDVALRSPRWDQVRGLVLLGSAALVTLLVGLLFVLVVLTGVVVIVRTVMEGWT